MIKKILARDLVARYTSASLIGAQILTPRFGDWPGGVVTILEVTPDPNAPEIVLWVRSKRHGEIGVFDFEEVGLFTLQHEMSA